MAVFAGWQYGGVLRESAIFGFIAPNFSKKASAAPLASWKFWTRPIMIFSSNGMYLPTSL